MTLAAMLALLLAQASPSPSPAPTSGPCFHEAEVVKPMYPTFMPGETPLTHVPLYATLSVVVAPDGKIEKIAIYKSSGDDKFDMASIRAAQKSVFKPKVVNCQPVDGTYLFRTSLTPGG